MGLYSRSYSAHGGRKHEREQCGEQCAVKYRRRKIFIIRARGSGGGSGEKYSPAEREHFPISRNYFRRPRARARDPPPTTEFSGGPEVPMRNFYRESAINLGADDAPKDGKT